MPETFRERILKFDNNGSFGHVGIVFVDPPDAAKLIDKLLII